MQAQSTESQIDESVARVGAAFAALKDANATPEQRRLIVQYRAAQARQPARQEQSAADSEPRTVSPADLARPMVIVGIETGVIVKVVLVAILVWFALGAIGAAMLFALGAI